MKYQAANMNAEFFVQKTQVKDHMDKWLDHLHTTLGSHLKEVIEFMQHGDVQRGKNRLREDRRKEKKDRKG